MSAKPRGLGRGLDALLPKVDKGIQLVPLVKLTVSPFQPRKRIDEAAIVELAASIADKGILQPLVVRPLGAGYEIVAGERRFRAAERAGLSSVPVVVRDLDDRATLEIAIIENLQREDLTPVEEARAFQQLMDFGLNQEAVAKSVGKSRSAIANTLRLLKLPEAALQAVDEGTISAGHARAILAQPEEDRDWAFEQIVARDLNVREAEALKRPEPGDGKRRRPAARRHEQLEDDLSRHVGARVLIKGGERGRLELHFHTPAELERLLDLLGYQP